MAPVGLISTKNVPLAAEIPKVDKTSSGRVRENAPGDRRTLDDNTIDNTPSAGATNDPSRQ